MSEFRIECSKEDRIIVSQKVKEFYSVSSNNRKSAIVIETINAVDDYSSSFIIIIQKQEIMIS
jgi:hypothetical protein